MVRICRWLVATSRALAIALVLVVGGNTAQAQDGATVKLAEGVSIAYPAGWSLAPRQYANAQELLNVPAGQAASLGVARILITTETQPDHAEALRRLGDIASESKAPTTFLTICGWPAVQRRELVPMEQPGTSPEPSAEKSLRVTTAVAVDVLLVRMQGFVPPDGAPATADEIEAIGRSLSCRNRADEDQVDREIEELRRQAESAAAADVRQRKKDRLASPAEPPEAPAESGGAAASPGAVQVQTGVGEIELAVSNNGQNIVMAANSGFANSTNGGVSFTFRGGTPFPPGFFRVNGDPSLAVGQSGNFYYAFIGFPTGTSGPPVSRTQCSTTVGSSNNNGQSFANFTNATLCDNNNGPTCFPDQEHIGADRVNAAAGGDQVYSVWRNFSGGNCDNTAGPVIPSLVCSQNNGANWSAMATVIEAGGDFPRVTVGQDGFVYVVYRNGGNIRINKFSSCSAGLAQQAMFPRTVTAVTDVTCPVAGLDRCNDGNRLSSWTAAVDDTNANHVFVAYASSGGAANDNVFVIDSTDGGVNWGAAVQINGGGAAARFMPWACSIGGAARVSWYDRRSGNDLTDFFCGSASNPGGGLVAGAESNLTNNPDPQCNSGWPCAPRATGDSENCPTQPQQAGVCCTVALQGSTCPAGMGSGNRCDFSDGNCPMGETCRTGGGCPKYGDYNGIACGAGRVFSAWSSATAPMGLPAPGGLAIFFDSKLASPAAGVDLQVAKSDNPDPVVAGTNLTYSITVTNNGPATALNVQLSDTLPATVGFVSNSPVPAGWSCMNPPLNTSGPINCSKAFMAIGEMATFTFVVSVPSNQPAGSMLSNTAMVSSPDPDPVANNSSTATTGVIAVADLAVTKNDTPDPVIPGTALTYTITIVNNGPSDAANATMTEDVPLNTTFNAVFPPPGWSCLTPPVNGTGTIACSTATLPLNASATFMVRVRVNAGLMNGTIIQNTVATASDATDPDPDNNSFMTETAAQTPVPAAGSLALLALILLLLALGARSAHRAGRR